MRSSQRRRQVAAMFLLVLALVIPNPPAVAAPARPRTPCTRPEQVGGAAPGRAGGAPPRRAEGGARVGSRIPPEGRGAPIHHRRRPPAPPPPAGPAPPPPAPAPP